MLTDSASTIYGLTFLWCIPSPVLLFINAEAWVITHALLEHGTPLGLGLAAAAGQLVGYTVVFFASDRVVRWLPKLDGKLQTFDAQRYSTTAYSALAIGTVVGLPPTVLLTLCSRALGYRYLPFILICAVGRSLRFCTLASLPETFAKLFGAG